MVIFVIIRWKSAAGRPGDAGVGSCHEPHASSHYTEMWYAVLPFPTFKECQPELRLRQSWDVPFYSLSPGPAKKRYMHAPSSRASTFRVQSESSHAA